MDVEHLPATSGCHKHSMVGLMSLSLRLFACFVVCGGLTANAQSTREESASDPIATVDRLLRSTWQSANTSPTKKATDGEWCRRLFIDLVGRIPRVSELRQFLADRSKNRREKLVDRLLYESLYEDEFAQTWADYWTVTLIGRSEGRGERLMSREGMHRYLEQAIRENRPYDQMVHQLITARGTSEPDHPDFNGAVNFLMLKVQDDAVAATSKTAQLFLGTRIQCTQCHDHPFNSSTPDNDWSQAQFWGFNSFFRQTVALRRFEPGSRDIDHGELADQDFGGEGSTPADAEVYFSQRNGILRAAYPTFLDGTALENTSGYLTDVNRRAELARLLVASPLLEKALANRLWSYFLGFGFTTPVDDFGPHNPPSHPQLFEELSALVRANGFDLRKLMRWIVLSEPYSLSSRTGKSQQNDDPNLGQSPRFSRFYMRQMRPETLYDSMMVAGESDIRPPNRERWLRQFVIASGNDEGIEASTFNGTIPQTLMMFNGALVQRATSMAEGSYLDRLAKEHSEPRKIVESMYAAALSRRPNGAEMKMALQLLASVRSTDQRQDAEQLRLQAMQDLWWVLLNSGEFILVH